MAMQRNAPAMSRRIVVGKSSVTKLWNFDDAVAPSSGRLIGPKKMGERIFSCFLFVVGEVFAGVDERTKSDARAPSGRT